MYNIVEADGKRWYILQRSGNPFVDTGWYAIAALSDRESVSDITKDDIIRVLSQYDISDINSRLKSFTMIFGTNGPLFQNAFRPHNKEIYHDFLEELIGCFEDEALEICEICGCMHSFNINKIWNKIAQKYNIKSKEEKTIGRDFFPLIGSLGNDAQALPGASRMYSICSKCLFAVNFIPMATLLLKGRLVCYESTEEAFAIHLVKCNVRENIGKSNIEKEKTEKVEIIGKNKGNIFYIKFVEDLLSEIDNINMMKTIKDTTALYIWLFSNAGTGADCDLIEIPNPVLRFIQKASLESIEIKNNLLDILNNDDKGRFFDDITNKKDCYLLYPLKNYPGCHIKLFEYYQYHVIGRSYSSLITAKKVARKLKNFDDAKEFSGIEVINESKNRRLLKKYLVDFVLDGLILADDVVELFNQQNKYLHWDRSGYYIILFYLNKDIEELAEEVDGLPVQEEKTRIDPKIKEFAQAYFNYYLDKEGKGRNLAHFKKYILDEFSEFGEKWLQDRFSELAREIDLRLVTLNYDGWLEFITDENGDKRINDLLFQLRLEFANLYKNKLKERDLA